MNDFTYYLLADLYDGSGSSLTSWDRTFAIDRDSDDADTKAFVLASIRTLLGQSLIRVGSYATPRDGGRRWQPWAGTVDEIIDRTAALYRIEDPDDPAHDEVWNCYLVDTPRGDSLFEAERARRVAAGINPIADTDGIWPTTDGRDPEVEL